jgi:hypothetical protein
MNEIEIYGKKYKYKISDTYDYDIPGMYGVNATVTIFYDGTEHRRKSLLFSSKIYDYPKYAFHIFHNIESKEFKHRKDWNKILKEASDQYLNSLEEFIVKDPNIKYIKN